MSAASAPRMAGDVAVTGARASGSIGVARYAERLAAALSERGIDYRLADSPQSGRACHFHFANSSRGAIWQRRRASRFVVTVHDVLPRTRELAPLYRAVVYRGLLPSAAAVVVHSRFAAELLLRRTTVSRLEVIPHPAPEPARRDRAAAREALGLPSDRLVAVLPGVLKGAKELDAIAAAASGSPQWLLVLAGRVADSAAVARARAGGAVVLESPDDRKYELSLGAADAVLCLRRGSVGETNGPLLDAIGAGRAVLATRSGSIPEVAGDAARYTDASPDAIRRALHALADDGERAEREHAALERAAQLSWAASAEAHAQLFEEVFGG